MTSKGIKPSRMLPQKPGNIHISLLGSVTGKADKDMYNCWLTGAVLLSEDKVVVCDLTNECIKIIDMAANKVAYRIRTKRKPWAIGKVDIGPDVSIYVTIPNQQIIQCFNVMSSGGLASNTKGTISTNGDCYGIVGYTGFLIVSFTKPTCRVDMIDTTGSVLKTFPTEQKGVPLFIWPDSVCLNGSQTVIYVADSKNRSVVGISVDGTVMGTYKDDSIEELRGVTTDANGNIYLSSLTNDAIHLVTSAFKKVKVILSTNEGLVRPCSLSYRPSDHTIIVGSKDSIKLFQLK